MPFRAAPEHRQPPASHGTLPIYAAIAGTLPPDDRAFLDTHGVRVLASSLAPGTSPTFMKWRALAHRFLEADVLYLDTDTLVFENPERLFELAGPEDFHARLEMGCDADTAAYPYLVNVNLVTSSHVDHRLFASVAGTLGARVLPIFNTGVMLFRNGLAGRLGERWGDVLRLERMFRRKQLPYSCTTPHILEEIVAPLALGAIDGLTWDVLPLDVCPSFLEYRGRNAATPGLILHSWAWHYAACLLAFGDREAALAYRALPQPGRPGWKTLRTRLLPLGSTVRPLPRPAIDRWLRLGAAMMRPGIPSKA